MPAQEAAAQNERKRSAESAQALLSRMQAARPDSGRAAGPPPPRVTELTPAEAAKEEGNAALKHGDVAQARGWRTGAEMSGLCRAWCSHAILSLISCDYTGLKGKGLGTHLGLRVSVFECVWQCRHAVRQACCRAFTVSLQLRGRLPTR